VKLGAVSAAGGQSAFISGKSKRVPFATCSHFLVRCFESLKDGTATSTLELFNPLVSLFGIRTSPASVVCTFEQSVGYAAAILFESPPRYQHRSVTGSAEMLSPHNQGARPMARTKRQTWLEMSEAAEREALAFPPGKQRDALMRKSRQFKIAADMGEWMSSPGLQSPT
jgi:hypothetical protein